ncbi:mannose/cellobiose epimerase-like protein (N-acyl-D-glucosamine 2-epimerase family) [Nocardiopsis mwathae]|uniref:Mannose/cellobiose epimerase-like protein (N-acyl-D-glucosamine 2-epimerase family) n=1 Tax=Nocardiopsis mwathae TaxID=1472723 RepID=A0A7W9YE92_9ACTN|nr:AGE family epimerase/isomerase [Nocardiopsis mwathae]MBB6170544.1 mannose/cellobiose epimerase-like protein (N-acyl-D-glucosamine 2-epimerase family) [Nocardiopsis mwathae]
MRHPWPDLPFHREWLRSEALRLLSFAAHAQRPADGFGWLDDRGALLPAHGTPTWITCRMTHVFALADLMGVPGTGPLADHGVRALRGPLRDAEHGGWYAGLGTDGRPEGTAKSAYDHAFVLLSAASAAAAGREGGRELLEEAAAVIEERFGDGSTGRYQESWDRAWAAPEDYRGANSHMHLVEAFLATADATGDRAWLDRALDIARFVVHEVAAAHDWRLPEHFTADWRPVLDYNTAERAHPFRPYGVTVGHLLEWARLLVQLELALGPAAPAWLPVDAAALFDAAVRRGWDVDGAPGFVYTHDWDDTPVVRERMHWVVTEAISAAATLYRRTAEARYAHWYRVWWDYAERHFTDRRDGSWHHELGPDNTPASTVWVGKPDIYHAFQTAILPCFPPAASFVSALGGGVGGPAPQQAARREETR